MNNLFEQASRRKLRFETNIGSLSTEQLWELNLSQLDEVAISLNKKVKASGEESFIKSETKVPKELQLRFDVVKHIIDVKLEEAEKAVKAAERKAKREKLLNALANKQDEKISKMSIAALEKELDALEEPEAEE